MPIFIFSFWIFILSADPFELGGVKMDVELAQTDVERQKGLSHRTFLADHSGMLFIFEKPQILSFWMKDTWIPLSIGFFDANRKLIHWLDMDPPLKHQKSLPVYQSKEKAMYALEVPKGWFEKNKIKSGMTFTMKKTVHSLE